MASLEQLQRLAFRANQATDRFDRFVAADPVVAEGQALVREAKAAGLSCQRIVTGARRGYDCLDPVTKALFQVRVEREGSKAKLAAAVHGIDRARRAESPLVKAKRQVEQTQRELEECRRSCGTAPQRSLF